MKVLLVNKFNFLKGGADKYFLDLAEVLKADGIKVAKFCMDHPDNLPDKNSKYFVSNINFNQFKFRYIFKYAGRMLYSFEAKRNFKKLVTEFKPDIIHIHNIYHQISPSILSVAKAYNIPVVMHTHDYKLVCANYKMFNKGKICEKCKGGKHVRCAFNRCVKESFVKSKLATVEMYFHHKILNIYRKNIDMYLTPTLFVKNKLVEWGIEKKVIKVVPHFLDVKNFEPKHGLGDYFLYYGRIDQEKGVDRLIEAIKDIKDVKLKIVGSGPEAKNIQKQILKEKLGDRVELVGPKYGDELKDIIRNSFLVVVPSVWYEVFGLINLESAALGKCIIASDIGGIPEAVEDKKTALLYKHDSATDLADKLRWSLDNRLKIKEFGKAGRAFVEENFTIKSHLTSILKIYKEVIRKNKKN